MMPIEDISFDVSIVDWANLREDFEGDGEILEQIAAIFLEEHLSLMENVYATYVNQDCRAQSAAAHSLKGCLANFYATSALDVTAHLEFLADTLELEVVGRAIEKLSREMDRLLTVLSNITNIE